MQNGAEHYRPIRFAEKFERLAEQWQPRVVAEMNDYQFKIVKLKGDFIWHDHKDTDETFIVLEGDLCIDFRDGAVRVSAGEMFVVPKGIEHTVIACRALPGRDQCRRGLRGESAARSDHPVGRSQAHDCETSHTKTAPMYAHSLTKKSTELL